MTTSRSKVTDAVGLVLVIIGFGGFFMCWQTGWNAQERILGKAEFTHPSEQRPAAIEMKGGTFFVEPEYADRFRLADNLIFVFWGIAGAGMAIRKRDKIAAWWKSKKS